LVKRFFSKAYIGLILAFLYMPILVLIVFSFNKSRTMSKWGGFTLSWYSELFNDPMILEALWITISVAVLSAIIATIIGTLAAIGIHNMRKGTRRIVTSISYIPKVTPDIVTGISLMLLFIFLKIPRGYFTLLLSHITFNIPYVIFSVMPKLKQMPASTYEAALDLGATPGYAMRKVLLPQIMPGIITGLLFAFTLSLDDFVVSLFTRQDINTLSIIIYSMARKGISPKINALSALMFVSIMALMITINFRTKRNGKKEGPKL
jgi:spermidine/putrescine transport system permease protein